MQPQGSAPPRASASTLWAGVAVLAILVAGTVALAISNHDSAANLGGALVLAIPVILNLLKTDRIEQHAVTAVEATVETNDKIDQIEKKVNGELRNAALDAAREAAAETVREQGVALAMEAVRRQKAGEPTRGRTGGSTK